MADKQVLFKVHNLFPFTSIGNHFVEILRNQELGILVKLILLDEKSFGQLDAISDTELASYLHITEKELGEALQVLRMVGAVE